MVAGKKTVTYFIRIFQASLLHFYYVSRRIVNKYNYDHLDGHICVCSFRETTGKLLRKMWQFYINHPNSHIQLTDKTELRHTVSGSSK